MNHIEAQSEHAKQYLRLAFELEDFAHGRGMHYQGRVHPEVKAKALAWANECRELHRKTLGEE